MERGGGGGHFMSVLYDNGHRVPRLRHDARAFGADAGKRARIFVLSAVCALSRRRGVGLDPLQGEKRPHFVCGGIFIEFHILGGAAFLSRAFSRQKMFHGKNGLFAVFLFSTKYT